MRASPLLLPLSLLVLAGCSAHAAGTRADAQVATASATDTPPGPPPASNTDTHVDPKSPQGAIGGRVQFPSGVAPAMRICALSPAAQQCIDAPAGRTLYRIEHLPDGDYQVVARVENADTPVAGHVHAVQCIRAPCPDQLETLELRGNKEIATADLNGFYAARSEFPPVP